MQVNTRRHLGLLALTGVVSVAALLRCWKLARRATTAAEAVKKTAEVTATRLGHSIARRRAMMLNWAWVRLKVHAGVQAEVARRYEAPAHTLRAMEDLSDLLRKTRLLQKGDVRQVSRILLHEKLHNCLSHLCFHEVSQEHVVVQAVLKHHHCLEEALVQAFRQLSTCASKRVIVSAWKRAKIASTFLQRAMNMERLHGRRLARAGLRKWFFVLRCHVCSSYAPRVSELVLVE